MFDKPMGLKGLAMVVVLGGVVAACSGCDVVLTGTFTPAEAIEYIRLMVEQWFTP